MFLVALVLAVFEGMPVRKIIDCSSSDVSSSSDVTDRPESNLHANATRSVTTEQKKRYAATLKAKRIADKAAKELGRSADAIADPILSAQQIAARLRITARSKTKRAEVAADPILLQSANTLRRATYAAAASPARAANRNTVYQANRVAAVLAATALADAAPRRLAASADTPKDSFVSTFQTNVIASKVCYRQTPTACFTLLTTPTHIALADIVLGANPQLVIRMGS